MVSFFGGKEKSGSGGASADRVPRHSSGWGQLLKRMQTEESLRLLDMGPTSSGNINFVTALGHSIYLANLVEDASKRDWIVPGEDGAPRFDVPSFLVAHLGFSGRGFDIVLLWDTLDYLPEELVGPVIDRLHEVMAPGGQMLALFHPPTAITAPAPAKGTLHRYHLTGESTVSVQRAAEYPLLHSYTNRQIERLLAAFKGFHFFLSKDNIREVLVTR